MGFIFLPWVMKHLYSPKQLLRSVKNALNMSSTKKYKQSENKLTILPDKISLKLKVILKKSVAVMTLIIPNANVHENCECAQPR